MNSSATSLSKRVAVTVASFAALMAGHAKAQTYDFYTANLTTQVATNSPFVFQEYNVDSSGNLTALGSYSPGATITQTETTGTRNNSNLNLTGDGGSLSYGAGAYNLFFNLSTHTFDTSTQSNQQSRAVYTASPASGNPVYLGSPSGSPYSVAYGSPSGTIPTLLTSATSNSTTPGTVTGSAASDLVYDPVGQNLYTTGYLAIVPSGGGAGAANKGVFRPSTYGAGLLTATQPATLLSGTGWNTGTNYLSLAMDGATTMIVANSGTTNGIQAFANATPSNAASWNVAFSLSLPGTSATRGGLQNVSFVATDANGDGLVFFTTSPSTTAGTSELGEVVYNTTTGFGTPTILATSTTSIFDAVQVVGVVPEPSTYVGGLMTLGLIFWQIRRRAAKGTV